MEEPIATTNPPVVQDAPKETTKTQESPRPAPVQSDVKTEVADLFPAEPQKETQPKESPPVETVQTKESSDVHIAASRLPVPDEPIDERKKKKAKRKKKDKTKKTKKDKTKRDKTKKDKKDKKDKTKRKKRSKTKTNTKERKKKIRGKKRPSLPERTPEILLTPPNRRSLPGKPPSAEDTIATPPTTPTKAPIKKPSPLLRSQGIEEVKRERARFVIRKKVIAEIMATESSYVNSLRTVVKQVVSPLRHTTLKIITKEELGACFMNIEDILLFHEKLLQTVKDRIDAWTSESTIGDIFLQNVEKFSIYRPYLQNYNTSMVTVRYLLKKNENFAHIRDSFEREQLKTNALGLEAFLIMPVQRLPRYLLLMRELIKYTAPDHPDFNLLEDARLGLQKVLDEINSTIDANSGKAMQKIIALEDLIHGLEEFSDTGLMKVSRRLLKEGLLVIKIDPLGKKRFRPLQKQFYVFSFNDVIMCCGKLENAADHKGKGTPAGKEFIYAFSLALRSSELIENVTTKTRIGSTVDHPDSFALRVEGQNMWTIKCKSQEEKKEWMACLRPLLKK
eukprot:TRINITY_DN1398_c0_g1_i1.p1 TRINITY_DN1398_c0_g1~~TRINITY_DN1398_c0_g1_i1.p1  ORF type:complete len:563 (-),score=123.30 TRINITY_DN1398_c0_g1_i1:119-1807(-)